MLSERDWPGMLEAQAVLHGITAVQMSAHDGMEVACDFYEDLIDKSVLMVVKTSGRSLETYRDWYDQTFYNTDCCNRTVDDEARFCPGCGARIKQA